MPILNSLQLSSPNRIVTSVRLLLRARQIHHSAVRMAVNPKFPGHQLSSKSLKLGSSEFGIYSLAEPFVKRRYRDTLLRSPHTLELYLDYVCPFSKKQFFGLYDYLTKNDIPDGVDIIFRHQVQPWHPSSTLVHEAALAVASFQDADEFWAYSYVLFQNQDKFFDVNVVNETRNQTYRRLIEIYRQMLFKGPAGSIPNLHVLGVENSLLVGDKPGKDGALNIGNLMTDDLKLQVKLGRQNGIHVSPTVLWDGLVENSISSSFGEEQWIEFFKERLWAGDNWKVE